LTMIRRPIAAGQFYESDAESLRSQIKSCFLSKLGPRQLPDVNRHMHPRNIVGLICPHAGFMYSGAVAASAYFELAMDGKPDVVVLLGPNHTGYGSGLALMREGIWRTPLGDVNVDSEVAEAILHETRLVDVDELAHRFEHSIEVQLPFLQDLYGAAFKIVPICFLNQDYYSAIEVGRALVEALDARNALVVASSDMTHYEPAENAGFKDRAALKAVLDLNSKKFYDTIESENVSSCGFAPIAALITYAKGVNTREVKLLSYHTSGDITGDYSSVVGYASVSFKK
jgi:MEMO1 family protein